jgi:hypothetical protein
VFPPISDHQAAAIARLVSQYADAERLKGLISALVGPIQEIETALATLNTLRSLELAEGVNLDLLGTIVGLARPSGDDDATYRNKLKAQIKVNVSEGQPEQAIQTFQLFTGAQLVILNEYYPAEVIIGSEHAFADQAEVDTVLAIIRDVLPAGVRANGFIEFDPTEAFAFDGIVAGLGWGDSTDPLAGGKFATIRRRNTFFAFEGDAPSYEGFGSTDDPLVGGLWASV